MTVINVNQGQTVHLAAGTVPGNMNVYCVGPGPATFGITIVNPPPPFTMHHLIAGHMLTFQVDGFPAWVQNQGPSKIQLLFTANEFDADSLDEIEGAEVVEGEFNYRYYNVRIVGPPPAKCAEILECTTLHLVEKCDNCFYRIRTSQLYKKEVQELFEKCAAEEGYPDATIEVNAGPACT
ncbi:MAG: hypothetical protein AAGN66_08285 [Acidobacteriota bacterium]